MEDDVVPRKKKQIRTDALCKLACVGSDSRQKVALELHEPDPVARRHSFRVWQLQPDT
jgi:hypothetical protein